MFYPCQTFKPISDAEPSRLADLEELRHTPRRVYESEGHCIAEFPCGTFIFPVELEETLRDQIGKRTAILHIDGRFLIRNLDAESHA